MKQQITRFELDKIDRLGVVADQVRQGLDHLAEALCHELFVDGWDEQARMLIHAYVRTGQPQNVEQLLRQLGVAVVKVGPIPF